MGYDKEFNGEKTSKEQNLLNWEEIFKTTRPDI